MGYLSMTMSCAGCKKTVADDTDMLVEVKTEPPVVVHVDYLTCKGLRMRGAIFGPYCDEACWKLDAQPGDVFVDKGPFNFEMLDS